jgi:hypothetical protein
MNALRNLKQGRQFHGQALQGMVGSGSDKKFGQKNEAWAHALLK